jgi:predicted O-methyltransferase YrrM
VKDLQTIVAENPYVLIEPPDLLKLLTILQPLPVKRMLEIGTRQGFSFRAFVDAFNPEIAITVDILKREEMPAPDVIPILTNPGVHYLWGYDSRQYSTLFKIKELLKGRELDFLFIDGSHMLEDVTKDWATYSTLVRPGGIVALHDIIGLREDMQVEPLFEQLIQIVPHHEIIKETLQSTGIGVLFL